MNKTKKEKKENSSHNSCFPPVPNVVRHVRAGIIHNSAAPRRRGFTLVELMVSIAIFLIISGVVIMSPRRFGGNIMITNLAYDVSLGIRQAQVYGTAMKQNTQNTFRGYGVHFASRDHFILFTDSNTDATTGKGNGFYDTDSDNGVGCLPNKECVSFFKIGQGNSITELCADNDCVNSGEIDSLDIIFYRPDPEPVIIGFNTGAPPVANYQSATITVTSPENVSRTVKVFGTGQISVQ